MLCRAVQVQRGPCIFELFLFNSSISWSVHKIRHPNGPDVHILGPRYDPSNDGRERATEVWHLHIQDLCEMEQTLRRRVC